MRKAVFGPSGQIDDMTIVEAPALKPGDGEVVVSVRAIGVNFGDTIIVRTPRERPLTPGYEVAGVVKAVGSGVRDVVVGDRVVAFPFFGGYADEVVLSNQFVYRLPANMDFATGAGLIATYGTAHHAFLGRATLRAGETVVILGASGGAGLTAIEIARIIGARVIAAASTAEKLSLCRDYGAHELVNYATEDLRARVAHLTDGKGADVIFDPVGGAFVEPMLKSLQPLGRYLVIGFASGDTPNVSAGLLLVKQVALIGVYWGEFLKANPDRARTTIMELFDWYAAGKLRPLISETFSLDQASEAMRHLVERKAKGKVVLIPSGA